MSTGRRGIQSHRLKSTLIRCLICSSAFNVGIVQTHAQSLSSGGIGEILNPSFEDPAGFLTNWFSCLSGESSIKHNPVSFVPDPPFHDGENSAGMSSVRPGDLLSAGAIFQEVPVTPGRTYRVHCWGTLADETGYQDDFMELRIRDGDSTPINCNDNGANIVNNSGLYAHLDGQPDTEWTLLEGDIIPSANVITVIAYWKFSGSGWGEKGLHLDDWSMQDITPSVVQFSNFQFTRTIDGADYDITISYDTAIPTTTRIEWGPTFAYGNSSTPDPNEVTHHVVMLDDVAPGPQAYHYRAHATAAGGIDEYSSDQTFHAPLVTFSGINAAVHPGVGTVCTISWSTNYATTVNKAFYGQAGSGEPYNEVPDLADPQARTIHSAVLAGLNLATEYEYYVQSAGDDIISAASPVLSFQTPAQAGYPIEIGAAMVGGDIPDGGDDIGPANEVQDMFERDHPVITISGMVSTTWAQAQPDDPGDGPDVYDFSSIDAKADKLIPGKALLAYYQMWGTSPPWADWENDPDRFWQKFENFIEAMVVYINQNYGTVYYTFENEPNIPRAPDGWSWDDWYIHCLQHFYPAVHAANAQTGHANKVIAGNLCGHSPTGFRSLYARGLKNCSDILGYHPYPYDIRDGLEVNDLAIIHGIQVDYDDADKRIFVSEGWGSGRSAGFDRTSHKVEPIAREVENMFLCMVNGWDNVMTPRENWLVDYLWGMKFFCGNDNWGAMNHRKRAIPRYDGDGDIEGFNLDGYEKGTDIAPYFWNGGMLDFFGNSKDCLIHVFPGYGLVFMNPGFELASDPPDAHLPHFWMTEVTPAPQANYSLDEAVFRNASRSLKLTQASPGDTGVHQMTVKRSAIGGVPYRARVWCKTQDGGSLAGKFFLRFCNLAGAGTSDKIFATDLTGTDDWRQMEVVATAPAGTERLEVGCYISGVGTAWFDDITIAMVDQAELGTIRGYTLDEGQIPVPDCLVRSTTGAIQAVSDASGYYEIQDVPTGTYDFVCRQSGYVPHRVKNQTVTAEKMTLVTFNMGLPKPGLTVTQVQCDTDLITVENGLATVTVTVSNTRPYPNIVSEVSLFVEQDGTDATNMFHINPAADNPTVIPESAEAQFVFTMTPRPEAADQSFDINAYAFGQEDRPDMLVNGGFDADPWGDHWYFTGGAATLTWDPDETDFFSPPRSLRCYVSDNKYTWNWANNDSAYVLGAIPASPGTNYTIGAHHKDNIVGGVSVELFIQEYYYDGNKWFYNGRRLAAVPHRSVWAHDILMYDTQDPNVTQGVYPTNRLLVSCGPCTSPTPGAGHNWWDNLYLKETGDWLADDRADVPATLTVAPPSQIILSTSRIDFSTTVGWKPADRNFKLRYAGPGILSYSVSHDVDWLAAEPDTGTNTGEPDIITITCAAATLPAGTYGGLITVSDDAGATSPQTITVNLTIDAIAPDFDRDGDVDQSDFGHLQNCLTGPGQIQNEPQCLNARLDDDEDVDEDDSLILRACMSGAKTPADPQCAD